jgi:hypothetical protein
VGIQALRSITRLPVCAPQRHISRSTAIANQLRAVAACVVQVMDPYWADVSAYGYQSLQPHQDDIIKAAEQHVGALRAATKARSSIGSKAARKAR